MTVVSQSQANEPPQQFHLALLPPAPNYHFPAPPSLSHLDLRRLSLAAAWTPTLHQHLLQMGCTKMPSPGTLQPLLLGLAVTQAPQQLSSHLFRALQILGPSINPPLPGREHLAHTGELSGSTGTELKQLLNTLLLPVLLSSPHSPEMREEAAVGKGQRLWVGLGSSPRGSPCWLQGARQEDPGGSLPTQCSL